jgi:hypothetical protein
MPSTSETGHAKNVANFEDLISFCNGYGATYNPSRDALIIAKITALQTEAKANLQQAKTTKTSFDNATNARQLAFKDLKPLATKVVNALAVSGATALAVADTKTINRKIQGAKANGGTKTAATPTEPNAPTPTDKTISTSQQSYDSLIDHFTKLIESIAQESSYKPNEADLQTATLQAKLDSLKTANSNLINGYTNWSNARINRNTTLYNPLTGLVQTAGASSPQFKQVSGLEFTNVKDR